MDPAAACDSVRLAGSIIIVFGLLTAIAMLVQTEREKSRCPHGRCPQCAADERREGGVDVDEH